MVNDGTRAVTGNMCVNWGSCPNLADYVSEAGLNMSLQLPLIALTFAALLVSSTDWGVVATELDLDDVDSTTTVRFAC